MEEILAEFGVEDDPGCSSSDGIRTQFSCDLCGYEPNTKNKFRSKQVLKWAQLSIIIT